MTAKEQGLPMPEVIATLGRIKAALPDVGVNGWAHGVRALDAAIAALASDTGGRGVVEITVGAGVHAPDLWLREIGIAGSLVYVPLDTSSETVAELSAAINPRAALRAQPAGGGDFMCFNCNRRVEACRCIGELAQLCGTGLKEASAAMKATPPESGGQGEAVGHVVRHITEDGSRSEVRWADGVRPPIKGTNLYTHPPAQAGGQGFMMVPRVASMGIRGVLYRTRSGYGDDYMTPEQADALWADLLAAAPAQPDGVSRG